MNEADPRAKLEPFQALIGEWTIEMTHPMVKDTVVRAGHLRVAPRWPVPDPACGQRPPRLSRLALRDRRDGGRERPLDAVLRLARRPSGLRNRVRRQGADAGTRRAGVRSARQR